MVTAHTRLTVNLTERSATALNEASDLTGDTRTDVVNRALQMYAWMMQLHHGSGAVYVRRGPDADLERVRFL